MIYGFDCVSADPAGESEAIVPVGEHLYVGRCKDALRGVYTFPSIDKKGAVVDVENTLDELHDAGYNIGTYIKIDITTIGLAAAEFVQSRLQTQLSQAMLSASLISRTTCSECGVRCQR